MKRLLLPLTGLALGALTLSVGTTSPTALPFAPGSAPITARTVGDAATQVNLSDDTMIHPVAGIADQDPAVDTTDQLTTGAATTVDRTEKTANTPDNGKLITVVGASWTGADDMHVQYRTRHVKSQTWSDWTDMPVSDDGPDATAVDATTSAKETESTDPMVVAPYEVLQVKADGPVTVSASVTMRTDVDDLIAGNAVNTPVLPGQADQPALGGAQNTAFTAENIAQIDGLEYVTRSQWGAKPEQCSISHTDRNQGVVIHHTDGANGYAPEDVPGILRGIQAFHQKSRGWCDIGYNMLIDRFGKVYEGRAGGLDKATVGAHAVAVNKGTFGVSVMGTYDKPAPQAVVDALVRVIQWQSAKWGWKVDSTMKLTSAGGPGAKKPKGAVFELPRVIGHRDVGFTDCPGDGLYSQIPEIRKLAASNPIQAYADDHELGKPTSEQVTLKQRASATAQAFGDTLVTSDPQSGTHGLHGAILDHWKELGWETSALGLPTGEEVCGIKDDGCYQAFDHGAMHWSKATGAHATTNAIHDAWGHTNYEQGELGYPTSDEVDDPETGGRKQEFQGGVITWTKEEGSKVVINGVSGGVKG